MKTPDGASPPPPPPVPVPDFSAAGLVGTRVLGVGAASVVYEGRDDSGACFAIKVPRRGDNQAVAALHHEAKVIQRLRERATGTTEATGATDQPPKITLISLVEVISLGATEALVLHPCAANNLREWMTSAAVAKKLAVLHELATALEVIHDAGIVHADLSPFNIVMHEGHPVIVDFASASLDGVARPVIHGTLPYAAPEVLRGDPPTARSDLYSLGRIACELLTGRADPDERQLSEATLSIDAGDELDALRAIILASISADPDERPRSAGQWRDALDSCAAIAKACPVALSDSGAIDVRGAKDLPTIDLRGPMDRPGALPATETHATREFGRRPPLATPEAIAPRPWLMPAFAATAAVIVVVAAVLGLRALVGPAGPSGRAGPTDQVLTASATAAATPATSVAPSEVVEWNPERAEATLTRPTGSRRYQIGAPGDQLLAGRWSCRGAATPVLYRPSTGDLFEFSGWAESNAPAPSARVQHLDLREGRLQLDRDGDCDRVSIAVGDRRVPVHLTSQATPR